MQAFSPAGTEQVDALPDNQPTALVYLQVATAADLPALQQLYQQSMALHHPFTELPDFSHYLHEHRYLLCLSQPLTRPNLSAPARQIVGSFSLSGIIRGKFHSAYLGFEVFSPYQQQGLMRQGLRLLIKQAFDQLGLHRLEANIQPANQASLALVKGAGFVQEGFSTDYLYINGAWRDHSRWALLNQYWSAD